MSVLAAADARAANLREVAENSDAVIVAMGMSGGRRPEPLRMH